MEIRITRLEARRRIGHLSGLSADELERHAFGRLSRMAARHGGIDQLLADLDRDNYPPLRKALDRLKVLIPDMRGWYRDREAQGS
jgi:hypothetical protein